MEERNKWLTDLRVYRNKKHRLYVSGDEGVQDEPHPQQAAVPPQSDSEDDDDEQTV